MDDDLFEFAVYATTIVSALITVVASCVPVDRQRFSTRIMVGGIGLAALALMGVLLDEFGVVDLGRGYEARRVVIQIVVMAIPTGLLVFSGGFLLSRFEARRNVAELDALRRARQSGSSGRGNVECGASAPLLAEDFSPPEPPRGD